MQIENIKTEYQHFQETYKRQLNKSVECKKNIKSNSILAFWVIIENLAVKRKRIAIFRRLIYRIKYGIKGRLFYQNPIDEMILICQF